MSEDEVRQWLLEYAWMGTEEDKAATVECIMHQDDWRYVDARAESFAGAQWSPGPEAFAEGLAFALSSLYECHEGPHLETCPMKG
jgi:hypothetical protein